MRKSVVGVGVALLVTLGACSTQVSGQPGTVDAGNHQTATATDAVQLVALAKSSTSKSRTVKMDATMDAGGQHVTMYLGNGQMLEASGSAAKVTVSPVRKPGMAPYLTRIIEY